MPPTTFRPGDDQSRSIRALKDLDHGAGTWETAGFAAGISGFQHVSGNSKAMGPLAVAGFSLDAEGAGCPGPALDPQNQAPVGGVLTGESL